MEELDNYYERVLAQNLGVKLDTILHNPDATLTNSEAIEFAKSCVNQRLAKYQSALKDIIYFCEQFELSENKKQTLSEYKKLLRP